MSLEKAYFVDEYTWKTLCEKRLNETNDLNMLNELQSLSYEKNKNKYAIIDLSNIYDIPANYIEKQLQKGSKNKINLIFKTLSNSKSTTIRLKIPVKDGLLIIMINECIYHSNLNKIELTTYPDPYIQKLIKHSLIHNNK